MSSAAPAWRPRSFAFALGLPAAALASVVCLLGSPASRPRSSVAAFERAAIVIRDPVHPVETLFTWLFVEPRLGSCYVEVRGFTQTERGAGTFGIYSDDHRADFLAALAELDARYERVDLFLLGHTNEYVSWVEDGELEPLSHLGLVYNSGCRCGRQAPRWMELGAAAYVEHPDVAAHAPFFVHFLRGWTSGEPAAEAVVEANRRTDGLYERLALAPPARSALESWLDSRAQLSGDARLSVGAGE